MKKIGHFIGGKHVEGKSGREADVFNPATGEVQAKVALGQQRRTECRHCQCQGGPAGMGRDQSAKARPGDDEIRRSAAP